MGREESEWGQPRRVGWGGRCEGGLRGGGHMYTYGLIHVDVCQKSAQPCEAIILQLKINTFLKKNGIG